MGASARAIFVLVDDRRQSGRRLGGMRSFLVRCWVVLLALAMIGGAARPPLHLDAPGHPPAGEHLHYTGTSPHDDRPQDSASRCCCDQLGCVTGAYTVPTYSGVVTPVVFSHVVAYTAKTELLPGRVLLPEPEPPRPDTLT